MNSATFRSDYYDDDGTRLMLTCADGDCLVEIVRPDSETQTVEVDVMFQSRDEQGRPVGPPRTWQTARVSLKSSCNGNHQIGRFWLPSGLTKASLKTCYFNVRPVPTGQDRHNPNRP